MMMNKYQTIFTEEDFKLLPKEVKADFYEFLETVPFIKWLIQPENVRGFAKNLTRWNNPNDLKNRKEDPNGKIYADITKPHILENMDYFRERAIFYDKYHKYTDITPNPNPKSDYARFWRKEIKRWREGMFRESDGEWIPGGLYFYWNYCPIWLVEETKEGAVEGTRQRKFPKPWLGDYLFFHYMEQARNNGEHVKMLKTRGVGASFKMGSLSPRNMYIYPGSGNPNFHLASDKTFLTGDKGVFGKVIDTLDWIADNTPLPKLRLVNSIKSMEIQLGHQDEYGVRKGPLSSVYGISLKDNPDKARGIRGPLIHYEEDGLFPHLESAWNINRKAVEDGKVAFGQMVALGTGGVSGGDFAGAEKLFYNPTLYRIYGIPNVYDKNSTGKTLCGFFWGAYLNRKGCYDLNSGEPDVTKALMEIVINRVKTRASATDSKTITQNMAEEPCIVGNTFISNTSIGSDTIIAYDTKFSNGIKSVYRLITTGGRKLDCTSNHKIYNGKEYKEAGQYKPGEVLKLKKMVPNQEYQEISITGNFSFDTYKLVIDEDWGRFVGLYVGDGSFYNNTLRIDFDSRDIESVQWFKNFADEKFKGGILKTYSDKNMLSVLVNSVNLKPLLIQLDLIEKWSGNKHGYKRKINTPHYIMKSPKSVIREYLKGYFDADSGIYTKGKNIKIYCKYLEQLEKVQMLLSAFDIFCIIKSEKKVNGEGRIFTGNSITLRSWEVDRFGEIGYISSYKQKLLEEKVKYNSKLPQNYDTDRVKSFNYIGEEDVYDIETQEHCYSANGIWVHNCTPQEAVMRIEGTVFPVADLKDYLEEISSNMLKFTSPHYVGNLVINSQGDVEFRNDSTIYPVRDFPALDNKKGAVEIFELPKKGKDSFRYISGVDPYDDDIVEYSDSLGSAIVFDRYTRRIVAEYTGRPGSANEFYEIVYRLARFYNATIMYENNKKGMFAYFNNVKGAITMLADTPEILTDKQLSKPKSISGNVSKGINATAAINSYGLRLQADWMLEPAYSEEIIEQDGEDSINKVIIPNFRKIRSVGYIKEAVAWHPKLNADRVSAMNMVMIYDTELSQYETFGTKSMASKSIDPFYNKIYPIGKDSGTLIKKGNKLVFGYTPK